MSAIENMTGKTNLTKFLDLIAWSEGTSTHPLTKNDGYDVVVSGVKGPKVFTDYLEHPFMYMDAQVIRYVPLLTSTAAGRYQLKLHNWVFYCKELQLTDFSPLAQDKIAIQQIKEERAVQSIEEGDVKSAIAMCSNIWASFPGNKYGQGGKTIQQLLDKWQTI